MGFNQESLFRLNLRIFDIGGIIKRIQFYLFKHKLFSVLDRNLLLVKPENSTKKAYVCALGPSLKQVDLNKIDGDILVVNRFFKIGKEYPNIVPTYYVMLDYGFNNPDNIDDFRTAINTYAPKGTIFILNSKLSDVPQLSGINPNQLFFISCFDGRTRLYKNYRINGIIPAYQNVVGASIMMLMLMGYKDINLLGCDFNSFASRQQVHCYHDQSTTRLYTMSQELFAYAFAAKEHEELQLYAQKLGVKITNSTRGSLIDAYTYEVDESLYR